jgi:GntR family transcriptional regulator
VHYASNQGVTMIVRLNFRSGVPVYMQIVSQVKAAAASGAVKPGDSLPSVRALAEELSINRNTVSKAYAELEAEGVLELRQGSGCFLKANGVSPLRKTIRSERLAAEIDALIVHAHHLQINEDDLRQLLDQRLAAFRTEQLDHRNG